MSIDYSEQTISVISINGLVFYEPKLNKFVHNNDNFRLESYSINFCHIYDVDQVDSHFHQSLPYQTIVPKLQNHVYFFIFLLPSKGFHFSTY